MSEPDVIRRRSMTEQEIAVRAIVETMRYLDGDDWLRTWADNVEQVSVAATRTFVCCPFCAEVECDDHCPLRHWPRGTYGWQNVPDDADHVVLDGDGRVVGYVVPVAQQVLRIYDVKGATSTGDGDG